MIDVEKFVGVMKSAGVDFFTGVPDSLLKSAAADVSGFSRSWIAEAGNHWLGSMVFYCINDYCINKL